MLAGARNFRAVRPYVGADGRRVRERIFFRSGELSRLTDADLAVFSQLGVRLVCDLRSSGEQAKYVSRWPDGVLHRHLELVDRDQSTASPDKMFGIIASLPGEAGALKAMDLLYRRKPAAFAGGFAALMREILAGDALPVLVHCHAGKDRTGFVVAMLLAAAGVARSDIFEDYLTTAQFFPVDEEAPKMMQWAKAAYGHELAFEAAKPMTEARADYLAAAFDEIDAQWGGIDGYLAQAVGLRPNEIVAYRESVLSEGK